MRVLHPLPAGVRGSDNANSVVIEVDYQGKRILVPGDLESPGLEDVIAESARDADVLMAPHHGSLRSSPAEFINWCTPEWLVISGGQDKQRSADQKLVFSDLVASVLHTAQHGAVTIEICDGELTVKKFLPKDH